MDRNDLTVALSHLETLHPNINKDALLEAHDGRACIEPGETGSSQMELVRTRLQEKRDAFYNGKGRTHRLSIREGTHQENGKQTLHIQTYVEHLDAGNVRSGYWAASWDVIILTERECELKGNVQIHSYYAEKSNVHMQATRDFPSRQLSTVEEKVNSMVAAFEKEKMSYEEQLAKSIVDTIWELEKDLYAELQTQFNEVDDSLKRIRRVSESNSYLSRVEFK